MNKVVKSNKKELRIIIDSNAFFVPLQFNIDIFDELYRVLNRNFKLVLISSVKNELIILSRRKSPKLQKKANFALKLSEKCFEIDVTEKSRETTDDIIVRIAEEWGVPVFTNDKNLKKRLRDISVPVIYVREKSRLEIDGRI